MIYAHVLFRTLIGVSQYKLKIVCACGRGRLRSQAVRTSGVGSIEILAQN
jgi:hypothetical protein